VAAVSGAIAEAVMGAVWEAAASLISQVIMAE